MKLLHNRLFTFFVIFVFLAVGTNAVISQELPDNSSNYPVIHDNLNVLNARFVPSKKIHNRTSEINFVIFDSLANSYSYFSDGQQPYIYKPDLGLLITIKRGAIDNDIQTNYTGEDTKNNLFVRTSDDWGLTWSDPVLLYNSEKEGLGFARYPSIDAFMFDGNLSYVYTSPVTDGDGWQGFINGFYDGNSAYNFSDYNNDLMINDKNYRWGTDSKIYGKLDGQDPYFFAVGGVANPTYSDWNDANNIAYRSTTDFGTWNRVIPEAWASDKFLPVQADSNRYSSVVDLVKNTDGKLYMGIISKFIANDENSRTMPGVSVSEDNGATWSEFDICPASVLRDYATSVGQNPDSVLIGYGSKGLVVLDNGDYSFVVQLYPAQYSVPGESILDVFRQCIEIYKENGTWGVRKIADWSAIFPRYYDNDQVPIPWTDNYGNQLDHEIQVSRTVDGNTIVAKWVDVTGIQLNDVDSTITWSGSDIFMAERVIGEHKWSKAMDVTNTPDDFDRVTWIPNLLPNDLKNIPILKTESIPNPSDDQGTAFRRQLMMEVPQYVMMGHLDFVVGVEDENNETNGYNITSVWPNPADDHSNINFTIPGNDDVKVSIYNVLGDKMADVYEGNLSSGLHSVSVKTSVLPTGTYYVNVQYKGKTLTQILSVMH